MSLPLLSVRIQYEHDVVAARQRTRELAEALGFDTQQQTRLATAVSEIARNAFSYAGSGKVEFSLNGNTAPQLLSIRVVDNGPGIRNLDEIQAGTYRSKTGMGLGIIGSQRLIDRFFIESSPGKGTTVVARQVAASSRSTDHRAVIACPAGSHRAAKTAKPFWKSFVSRTRSFCARWRNFAGGRKI